jgi:hypothetical protein
MINFSLRLPEELHARVKAAAEHERRSTHAEMLCLLERGLGMEVAPVAVLTQYQARPGRRAVVISDLADLRGPGTGKVILPLGLYWSPPGRVFDLDEPWMLREMYKTVLTEAIRPDDLTTWINGPRLVETWPDLRMLLPRGVRQAWEEIHDEVLRAPEPAEPAETVA